MNILLIGEASEWTGSWNVNSRLPHPFARVFRLEKSIRRLFWRPNRPISKACLQIFYQRSCRYFGNLSGPPACDWSEIKDREALRRSRGLSSTLFSEWRTGRRLQKLRGRATTSKGECRLTAKTSVWYTENHSSILCTRIFLAGPFFIRYGKVGFKRIDLLKPFFTRGPQLGSGALFISCHFIS